MKKQITLVLGALLFTACLRADESVVAPLVVPAENVEVVVPTEVAAPVVVEVVEAPVADSTTVDPKSADVVPAPKKSYVPTFAQAKSWCVNHKLVVGGAAATIGFVVLWKTCPAFRAFFGVEDEQEEIKFVL